MRTKKWLLISIISVFTLLSLNSLFLYNLDTYNILHLKSNQYRSLPNQRVMITEHILNVKNDYDSLIFGSSRVGYINPFHIKNQTVYNMTYAEGIPHEHLILIKLLLKKGMHLKHLLIGLDDISYQVPFAEHQQKLGSKSHYLATGESKFNFYKDFFFHKPTKTDYKQFRYKYITKTVLPTEFRNDIYDSVYNQKKLFSKKHPNTRTKEHINDPKFQDPTRYDANNLDAALKDIQEIADISKKYDIDTKFIIVPMHKKTYEYTNKKRFYKFRKELAKITSYYDFAQPNEINSNNIYWNETSHFTHEVGDMIIHRIYDNNISIKNFGIYVKKTN